MKRVVIPLPSCGFDPTEVAIPWKLLSEVQVEMVFITPNGEKPLPDELILRGNRLGIWKRALQARQDAVIAYHEMEKTRAFSHPLKYTEVQEVDFDALLLPGGHDKTIKEYLESKVLQGLVVNFFNAKKPVGAICHGVLLAARSIDPDTGRSVLYDYKTSALLKSQERLAFRLTQLWLKDYYLTYPNITTEDEVRSFLSDNAQFVKGPFPFSRDSLEALNKGFALRDRHYLSARWPGDVYTFATEFIKML